MVIDIFSLIVGAVMWELIKGYINSVIRPKIQKRRNSKVNKKNSQQQDNAKVQQPNTATN